MAHLALLDALFPELAATRRGCRKLDDAADLFVHALLSYQAVEALIAVPEDYVTEIAAAIRAYVRMRQHAALLKWAALLHAIGRPSSPGEGGLPGAPCVAATAHSAVLWGQVSDRLKLSRAHTEYVKLLLSQQHRLFEMARLEAQGALTVRLVYQWCKDTGGEVVGAFALAIGDVLARHRRHTPDPATAAFTAFATRLWELYRDRIQPVISGPRLLTGDDLRLTFALAPGPRYKSLLEAVELAQVEGRISSRVEALHWIEAQLRNG